MFALFRYRSHPVSTLLRQGEDCTSQGDDRTEQRQASPRSVHALHGVRKEAVPSLQRQRADHEQGLIGTSRASGSMDAFESLIAALLRREGYWVEMCLRISKVAT